MAAPRDSRGLPLVPASHLIPAFRGQMVCGVQGYCVPASTVMYSSTSSPKREKTKGALLLLLHTWHIIPGTLTCREGRDSVREMGA